MVFNYFLYQFNSNDCHSILKIVFSGGEGDTTGDGFQTMPQAVLAGNPEMKHFHIILEGKLFNTFYKAFTPLGSFKV